MTDPGSPDAGRPTRRSRVLLIGGLLAGAAVVAWALSAGGLVVGDGRTGLANVGVGETAYVGVARAQQSVRVLRVDPITVGPLTVEPVRCPDEALGSARDCGGGPVEVLDEQLPPIDLASPGPSTVVLAITRTGGGPAAVCGVRVVYAVGGRIGWDSGDLVIEVAEGPIPEDWSDDGGACADG